MQTLLLDGAIAIVVNDTMLTTNSIESMDRERERKIIKIIQFCSIDFAMITALRV